MNRIVMMSICISMPCAGMIPGARPSRKSVTFAAPADEERGAASSGALAGYGSLDARHSAESTQLQVGPSDADVRNPVDVPHKLRKDHPLQKYWPDSSSDDGEERRSCRCITSAKVCAAFCSTFGFCAGFLAYVMLSNHGEKPR